MHNEPQFSEELSCWYRYITWGLCKVGQAAWLAVQYYTGEWRGREYKYHSLQHNKGMVWIEGKIKLNKRHYSNTMSLTPMYGDLHSAINGRNLEVYHRSYSLEVLCIIPLHKT